MLTLSDVKESNKTSMRFAKPACVRRCPRSRRRINAVWTLIPCSASSVGKPICASWKSSPSAVCLMCLSPIRLSRPGCAQLHIFACSTFRWEADERLVRAGYNAGLKQFCVCLPALTAPDGFASGLWLFALLFCALSCLNYFPRNADITMT